MNSKTTQKYFKVLASDPCHPLQCYCLVTIKEATKKECGTQLPTSI